MGGLPGTQHDKAGQILTLVPQAVEQPHSLAQPHQVLAADGELGTGVQAQDFIFRPCIQPAEFEGALGFRRAIAKEEGYRLATISSRKLEPLPTLGLAP